jgi:hypothetical protein
MVAVGETGSARCAMTPVQHCEWHPQPRAQRGCEVMPCAACCPYNLYHNLARSGQGQPGVCCHRVRKQTGGDGAAIRDILSYG